MFLLVRHGLAVSRETIPGLILRSAPRLSMARGFSREFRAARFPALPRARVSVPSRRCRPPSGERAGSGVSSGFCLTPRVRSARLCLAGGGAKGPCLVPLPGAEAPPEALLFSWPDGRARAMGAVRGDDRRQVRQDGRTGRRRPPSRTASRPAVCSWNRFPLSLTGVRAVLGRVGAGAMLACRPGRRAAHGGLPFPYATRKEAVPSGWLDQAA
jgi:hypothetical protein